jgi:proline dehydrogenase
MFKVTAINPASSDPGTHTLVVKYRDVLSMIPEYILHTVVDKIVEKFVEEHYHEIAKELDPKLIAAIASTQMGLVVEEKMLREIEHVQHLAQEALRRAKKR